MGRHLLECWKSCVSACGNHYDSPYTEKETFQNCWSWALKRWLISRKGDIVIKKGRAGMLRCMWAPKGDKGPLWHFEPTSPKTGIKGIWHSFLHKGKPKNMRTD